METEKTKKYFKLTKTIIGPFLMPIFVSLVMFVFLDGKNPEVTGALLAYFVLIPAIIFFLWDISYIIHDFRKMNTEERKQFKSGVLEFGKDQWDIYVIFTFLLAVSYGLFYMFYVSAK